MAGSNPTRRAEHDCNSPSDDPERVEAAVISFLFAAHPALVTMAELKLALSARRKKPYSSLAIEDAVMELAAGGLLNREGDALWLSRASIHFEQLEATS